MPEPRSLERMARDIFELTKISWMMAHRTKVPGADLSEQEFLTLDILQQRDVMIVGDMQRYLAVLPAQMSRIIKALETRDPPLIRCELNTHDKRKIDVSLTDAGAEAVDTYRSAKLQRSIEALAELTPEDRTEFMRILDIMHGNFLRRTQQPQPSQS